jgi:hypothetical protein
VRPWTLAVVAAQYLIEDATNIVTLRQRPRVADASVGCVLLLSRSAGIVTLSVNALKGGKTDGKRKVFGQNCS